MSNTEQIDVHKEGSETKSPSLIVLNGTNPTTNKPAVLPDSTTVTPSLQPSILPDITTSNPSIEIIAVPKNKGKFSTQWNSRAQCVEKKVNIGGNQWNEVTISSPSPYLTINRRFSKGGVKLHNKKVLDMLGVTPEQIAREKGLAKLGLTEDDLYHSRLLWRMRQTEVEKSKLNPQQEKIQKITGYNAVQIKRAKSIKVLGITEEDISAEVSHLLSQLGRKDSVLDRHRKKRTRVNS